jgi:excisionase family DNA binding protein
MALDITPSRERKQEGPSGNDVLSVRDLARELRIGKNAAYRLAHRLPHARVGDLIRIRRSDLERELWGDPSNEEGTA